MEKSSKPDDTKRPQKYSVAGQLILTAGAAVGVTLALATMSALQVRGALPGAIFGVVGCLLGMLCVWPIVRRFPGKL